MMSPEVSIRRVFVNEPNQAVDVLQVLSSDPDETVAQRAAQKLDNTPPVAVVEKEHANQRSVWL